ncbi:MAG: hypothetical protein NTZ91_05215 [Actinobacteria bacterium]|nr:hypothetical protein [Actinomycetota bacterium]
MSTNSIMEFFRPHKSVPKTPWTANGRWDLSLNRVMILFGGLFIFGIGDSLLIQGNIGNAPWSVLAQGVARRADITMGWSTLILSTVVLLAWIPLREKPGFGTISNILVIAVAIQIGVSVIPLQHNYFVGIIYSLVGVGAVGIATSLYITCGLGPGPRDGLMTALHRRTGVRVGRVRFAIESSVVVLGALLGGNVGLGTLLFAGLIGQSIAVALGVVSRYTAK